MSELCNHNTSVLVAEIGPYQFHQCTWQCQDVLVSRKRSDGVTEEGSISALFDAVDTARAAGFAEAIEQAAQSMEEQGEFIRADEIRALLPAPMKP